MLKTKPDKSLSHLCSNRRSGRRIKTDAQVEYRFPGGDFRRATTIESSTCGARLILPGKVEKIQEVELRITTPNFTLNGVAGVAWKKPLSNGLAVVGLRFLSMSQVRQVA